MLEKQTIADSVRCIAAVVALALTAYTQSTEQQLPTPVTLTEINGQVNARDIGDSRTTTYFYTFNGSQGDLFLNILTVNLNADIDLFIEQGLRPLTKIVVYADRGETETGRVVYLRKPEKLLLRVQGRSPNDDPGKFRFKFAGSFVAAASESPLPPEPPRVPASVLAEARPNPSPDVEERPVEVPKSETPVTEEERIAEEPAKPAEEEAKGKPKVVVTESVEPETRQSPRTRSTRSRVSRAAAARSADPKSVKETPLDPMAAFTLVIVFRDGSRIERPMPEVSRFSVDKGVLTVVHKGGQTGRYSMGDVVSVSVQ